MYVDFVCIQVPRYRGMDYNISTRAVPVGRIISAIFHRLPEEYFDYVRRQTLGTTSYLLFLWRY